MTELWEPGDRVKWRWDEDVLDPAEVNGKVVSDTGINVQVRWDDGADEYCDKEDLLWVSHAIN